MEISPEILITFLHLAESQSFSEASRHLGISQSTVSGHVSALERTVGETLLTRRRGPGGVVELTPSGHEFIGVARPLLDAHERARIHFTASTLPGTVRLAIADDIASHVSVGDALRTFRRRHPGASVEINVGQSGNLARRLRAGQFDLALVKRLPTDRGSDVDVSIIRRERIVWAVHQTTREHPGTPFPLVAYPTSSFLRTLAVERLESAGIPWRITNTVRGVNGAMTAVRAELGVGVFAERMLPDDLCSAPPEWEIPSLGEVETVIAKSRTLSDTSLSLLDTLEAWGQDLLRSRRDP